MPLQRVYPVITWRYAIALLTLTLFLHEVHELVHIFSGRVACGCFGWRDFNVWGLCEGCSAIWPTLAGPAFTFALIWLGAWWLFSDAQWQRDLGFALVFANMPLARILTSLSGGGDEVFALRKLMSSGAAAEWTGLTAVLLLSVPPLVLAYRALARRHRWAWFLGFLVLPVALDLVIVLMGMNGLLEAGVLSEPGIWGTPVLVSLYTLVLLVLLALLGRHLVMPHAPEVPAVTAAARRQPRSPS
ncbi:MAG: hypothetical protein AAGJ10_03995 [Bacteroidota bacterium]